jgi:threonine dehydratase
MARADEEPDFDDITAAAARLAGHAARTPLISNPILDELTGARVLLKCESLQRTGSFKFRGAYNAVSQLDPSERARGIVAVSSGNHAQGVAEAARLFGAPATIVMPADAPAIKRQRTERSGARIVAYDRAKDDRDAIAAQIMAESGAVLVHPFNDRNVIAGQGTIGLEIAEELRDRGIDPDAVFIPCGGGGLSAGVGLALRTIYPAIAVNLAEPEGFDDYRRSLESGRIVANQATSGSVMDALLSVAPGPIGYAINRRNAAAAVTVSDAESLRAVAFAFRELKLLVEPGGAAGLAAVLSQETGLRGRTVLVVLSGGNVDEATLQKALDSG